MGKLEHQVSKLVVQYNFKSEIDWKMVSLFCKNELNLNFDKEPKISSDGIDVTTFTNWYENGFGSGDIVWVDDKLVIIGACNLEKAKVAGILENDKILEKPKDRFEIETSKLRKASEDDEALFNRILTQNKLQFAESNQIIVGRYIPRRNEPISFHKKGVRGIGVIRDISIEDNLFELYCYHIYQTKETKYSMHEEIGLLSEYTFNIATPYERKKLENELRKEGKSWNGKMFRVEPVNPKVAKGERYWFITEKMKLSSAIEEEKPTSHFRYLGGNYFRTYDDGLENLGKINEMLRDFLARPEPQ